MKISAINSWKSAWIIFKKNWLVLIYASIIPVLVDLMIVGTFNIKDLKKGNMTLQAMSLVALYYILKYLVDTFLRIGKVQINLDSIDEKKPPYSTMFNSQGVYFKFLLTSILFDLCVLGGLILFIIPGIYIILTYYFAPYLVLDKKMSVSEAFTRSKEMTSGKKIQILWFGIVIAFFALLGLIAIGFGVIATCAIAEVASFLLYRQLFKEISDTDIFGVPQAPELE